MINISSLILSVGFMLMIIGVRFMMVKTNLKLGRPSDTRLKAFKKEWSYLLPAGTLIFLVGFFSPYFGVSVDQSQSVANTGGVLFGLGIPQYLQWDKGRGTDEQIQLSLKTINKWAWGLAIVGGLLAVFSSLITL